LSDGDKLYTSPPKREIDMSTKHKNVYTSEERVKISATADKSEISVTADKPWVGLTDEDMSETYNRHYNDYASDDVGIIDFIVIARAIEAALRSKNENT
jgi:hypothetical protein